jgi:hypothetical protein
VKAQAAEREKWKCDKCRTERVRMLQEDLQNTLRQIVELKARSRELEQSYYWWELWGERERQCLESKGSRSVWWSVTQYWATLGQNMQI